jgi:hypothetical protein
MTSGRARAPLPSCDNSELPQRICRIVARAASRHGNNMPTRPNGDTPWLREANTARELLLALRDVPTTSAIATAAASCRVTVADPSQAHEIWKAILNHQLAELNRLVAAKRRSAQRRRLRDRPSQRCLFVARQW